MASVPFDLRMTFKPTGQLTYVVFPIAVSGENSE